MRQPFQPVKPMMGTLSAPRVVVTFKVVAAAQYIWTLDLGLEPYIHSTPVLNDT